MASTPVKIQTSNKTASIESRLKRAKIMHEGTLLYTDSRNMPTSLSNNTLLFTTDTRELYIGSGDGLVRVNLGSDGAIIDKSDYLTKRQLAEMYVQKDNLDPRNVITKQNIKYYIQELQSAITNLVDDNSFKADKDNVYSKKESNERFVTTSNFNLEFGRKVDKEVSNGSLGHFSYIQNDTSGVRMSYLNTSLHTDSRVAINKNGIEIHNIDTRTDKNDNINGYWLFVNEDGIFFTNRANGTYDKDLDRIITMGDLQEVSNQVDTLTANVSENTRIVNAAKDSVDESAKTIRAIHSSANTALQNAQQALNLIQQTNSDVNLVHNNLLNYDRNLLKLETTVANQGNILSQTSSDVSQALSIVSSTTNVVNSQIRGLGARVSALEGDVVEPDIPTYKTVVNIDTSAFNDVLHTYQWDTEVDGLELPKTFNVEFDDGTTGTVEAEWYTEGFMPQNYAANQYILGWAKETDSIKKGTPVAKWDIKILQPVDSTNSDTYIYNGYFIIPSGVDDFPHFANSMHISGLQSYPEAINGINDDGEYITPWGDILLLGSSKIDVNSDNPDNSDTSTIFTNASYITKNDVDRLLNSGENTIFSSPEYSDGIIVPSVIALNLQKEDYVNRVRNVASLGTNGAFEYDGDNDRLFFEFPTSDADLIYRIRIRQRG